MSSIPSTPQRGSQEPNANGSPNSTLGSESPNLSQRHTEPTRGLSLRNSIFSGSSSSLIPGTPISRRPVIRSDPSIVTCFDPADKELYDLWAPKT